MMFRRDPREIFSSECLVFSMILSVEGHLIVLAASTSSFMRTSNESRSKHVHILDLAVTETMESKRLRELTFVAFMLKNRV